MDHSRGSRLDGRGSMYQLLNVLLESMLPADTAGLSAFNIFYLFVFGI